MNYYTEKSIHYINSHNRLNQSDSNSDFSIKLDIDLNHDYTDVVCLDASIPKTNYTIGSNNNTFTVIENLGAGDLTRTITMPVGNYNRTSFKNVLKTQLNDNVNTYIYDITFDNVNRVNDTGKYTYTWTNVNGSATEPLFVYTTSLYEQCGFETNSSNVFVIGSLISINVVNLNPETTYFIHSDIVSEKTNILANIVSSGAADYNYITYHNSIPNEYSKVFFGGKSNVYRFTITDENKTRVDLNGLNVVFTIMLFKRNTLNKLIGDFIKLKTLESINDEETI
jgi:hypothetical protein